MLIIYDDKNRKSGVKKYLEQGTNNDRNKKDERITLLGDLDILDKTIKYSNTFKKSWKGEHYRNIVLSFEEDDISEETLKQIAQEFDENYTIGLNKDEYVSYAEVHYPKLKLKLKDISDPEFRTFYEQNKYRDDFDLDKFIQELNEKNITYTLKKRKPHIHYTIALYSPRLDAKLDLGTHGDRGFNSRGREIKLLKEYLEKKYNLKSVTKKPITQGRDEIYIKDKYSKQVELKKDIKAYITANINNYNEFEDMIDDITKTFKIKNIKYSTAKAKTKYISLKHPNFERNIKLKGDLFFKDTFKQAKKNLQNPTAPTYIPQEQGSAYSIQKSPELIKLQDYRIQNLNKRYRKKREFLSKEFKERQFKLFYYAPKLYKIKTNTSKILSNYNGVNLLSSLFKSELKNFTQNLSNLFNTAVKSYSNYSKAKAKKLELELKQERLKARFVANREQYKKKFEEQLSILKEKQTTNVVDTKLKEVNNKIKAKEIDLKSLKELVNAKDLLDYLHNKQIIKTDYEVLANNKIKVGQKRLNVLDFCLKELHLNFQEATTLLKDVYSLDLEQVKGDEMTKIDWGELKRTINPLILNKLFNANIDKKQIVKGFGANKDEYRIKVGNKHITITDYLLKELKFEYKDIKDPNFINKLKLTNKDLLLNNLKEINKNDAEEIAKRNREQVEFINYFNLHNLSIFAEALGYEYKKEKSTRTYQVLKKDEDTIIVYKNKKGHYRFKRPNPKNENINIKSGGIYELFASNGIKRYDLIVNKIKSINKAKFDELREKFGALEVGGYDNYEKQAEARNLWESYSNKVNFAYLEQERKLNINTINKYAHNFKQNKRSNIVVQMFKNDTNNGFKFVGNSHRNSNFKLIEGNKGVEILTPKGLEIGEEATIIVCENYVDGLSLAELTKSDKAIILSTTGQPNQDILKTITNYIKNRQAKNVYIAFDNDENGEHYTQQLLQTFKELGLKIDNIKRARPKNKDFNEDLKELKSKIDEINKDIVIEQKTEVKEIEDKENNNDEIGEIGIG